MIEVSIVGPGEGELALTGPTRMRILEDGSTTSHRLGVGEITIAPHTGGPPQHRHARHDEGFYVVSGTARFTVGEKTYDAPAGTLVMVPPGAPHTFANVSDEPVVLLNTFTPDLYVHYFRDVSDLLAGGQAPTAEAIISVMARYATVPATDYADEPEPATAIAGQPGPASVSPVTRAVTVTVDGVGAVPVSFTERGSGPACLLLHGGAGPLSVAAFADQLAADQIIQHSELEWTIARATRLTAKPARHPPRHSTAAITKGPYSLSRAAYAAALLDLAEQGAYPRQIVNITG